MVLILPGNETSTFLCWSKLTFYYSASYRLPLGHGRFYGLVAAAGAAVVALLLWQTPQEGYLLRDQQLQLVRRLLLS